MVYILCNRSRERVNRMREVRDVSKKVYCNRCNAKVEKSDLEEYTYQCLECDEDLYEFETYEK